MPPHSPTSTPDIAARRRRSDDLFAEHAALAQRFKARDERHAAEMAAASSTQAEAYQAEDAAWLAWEAARSAARAHPTEPALAAADRDAEAAYQQARAAAHTAAQQASAIGKRVTEQSSQDLQQLLTLGEQARAAQNTLLDAEFAPATTSIVDTDPFARDILNRCRIAQARGGGHPLGVWSTGEQLAVALVLRDKEHLQAMDFTAQQAASRVAGDLRSGADIDAWLNDIRAALAGTS